MNGRKCLCGCAALVNLNSEWVCAACADTRFTALRAQLAAAEEREREHNCFNDDAVAERLTSAEQRANDFAKQIAALRAQLAAAEEREKENAYHYGKRMNLLIESEKEVKRLFVLLTDAESALAAARGTIDDMTEHQVVLNDEIERLKDQPHEDPRRTEYVVGLEKTIDDIEKELEKTGNEPLKSEEPYATVQLGRWALVDEIHAIINHRKEKKDDKDDKEEREGTDR